MNDSRELRFEDLEKVLATMQVVNQDKLLITHGMYTMLYTARFFVIKVT